MAAEARCICCMLHGRVVLHVVVFGDLGGRPIALRLRRHVGMDMGTVRRVCVVGVHAQTQAVHTVNIRPNLHAPSKRAGAHRHARKRTHTPAHAHARARTRAGTHTRMRTHTAASSALL